MLSKTWVIALATIIGATALLVFARYRVPPGVTPMTADAESIAWIALATAVVSLISAAIGLVQKILELWRR